MRPLLASIALLSLACAANAAGVTFKLVWPEWHDAESFQSFYEERTGHELTGRWIVLRSQPSKRSGLYFLARVENPGPQIVGGTFVLHIINLTSVETKTFTFPSAVPSGSRLFEIGLTGSDWTDVHSEPVAWELELEGADGQVLAKKSSFLWEKPDR